MSADRGATHAQDGNGTGAAHPIYERREQMIEDLQCNVPHELREHSAWVLWKAEPKDGKLGEFDKVPWYASGRKRHGSQGSAQDIEQLTDFAGAMAALRNHGQDFAGVGFALLPCHPISALDLDHVDQDDARRALAAAVLDSGTYVETSPSGQGRRAFFADRLGFGNIKNHSVGVEVFETAGFVTVTGAELSPGVGLAPMPSALRARLAALLSTPKQRPTTHAQPPHAPFGLASLPRPLAERLRRGFPERAKDRSAYLYGLAFALRRANLTAAQALAILGDTDLPWIAPALERRSGDIGSARAWLWSYCVEPVYTQPLVEGSAQVPDPPAIESPPLEAYSDAEVDTITQPKAEPTPDGELLTVADMLVRFVHVARGPMVADRSRGAHLWRPHEFESKYRHLRGDKLPLTAIWFLQPERIVVDDLTFDPAAEEFPFIQGVRYFNIWREPYHRPALVRPRAVQPFLDHLDYLIPDEIERADLTDWLAHAVQRPGHRPHVHFLLVASESGTGRGWIGALLRKLFGPRHAVECDLHKLVADSFNSILSGAITITCNEVKAPAQERFSQKDRLKSLFTDEVAEINPKYQPRRIEKLCARFLMCSNREDALPLDESDRRVYVVACADKPKEPAYYAQLYGRLHDPVFVASVWHYLKIRDISKFSPGMRAPLNEIKRQMIAASRTDEQQDALEIIRACPHDVIFAGDLYRLVLGLDNGTDPDRRSKVQQITAAVRDAGLQTYSRKVKADDGKTQRVYILRSQTAWRYAPPNKVREAAFKCRNDLLAGIWDRDILLPKWTGTK